MIFSYFKLSGSAGKSCHSAGFFFPLPLDLLGSDLCFTFKSVLDLWLKAAI